MDIERLRNETPLAATRIHFNNAGASPMPSPVLDAVLSHLRAEAELGGYEAAEAAVLDAEAFYTETAALLGARPHEIAFADCATRAWELAFHGLRFQAGGRILTTTSEYASNYLGFLKAKEQFDIEIVVLPDDDDGAIDLEALRSALDERAALVAINHVPTHDGLVNPAEEVGRLARAAGVPFLLDACQSAGQIELDVDRLGCDMLAATGRKYLRGPRGTGFLYVREGILDRLSPPVLDLRSAAWIDRDRYELAPGATRFETWERNVAGQIGLARAVAYARAVGLAAIERRVDAIAGQLRMLLSSLDGVRVTDRGARKCGIVTFACEGVDHFDLRDRLRRDGINVSVSRARSARLDLPVRGLDSVVRASVHYFNTEEEVERMVAAVRAVLAGGRRS